MTRGDDGRGKEARKGCGQLQLGVSITKTWRRTLAASPSEGRREQENEDMVSRVGCKRGKKERRC